MITKLLPNQSKSFEHVMQLLLDPGEDNTTMDPIPEGYTRFYRGQTENFKLLPPLFRAKGEIVKDDSDLKIQWSYHPKEYKIVNEALLRNPEEFVECKHTFDVLAKLQHYGLPTRLLDITTNPLVALYFACTRRRDEAVSARTIYCIDIPDECIKYSNSNSVSILSNLAKCNDIVKEKIHREILRVDTMIQRYVNFLTPKVDQKGSKFLIDFCFERIDIDELVNEFDTYVKEIYNNKGFLHLLLNLSYSYEELVSKKKMKEVFIKIQERCRMQKPENIEINKVVSDVFDAYKNKDLLSHIRRERGYFHSDMKYSDLRKILCVKPKLDNKRVISQSGSFLLFGLNNADNSLLDDFIIQRIEISNEANIDLFNEKLKMLNIYEATLFNDFANTLKDIKDTNAESIELI